MCIYMYVYIHVPILCIYIHLSNRSPWPNKKWDALFLTGHFPQKSPVIRVSFAERDLQLKASYASSPPSSEPTMCVCVCS